MDYENQQGLLTFDEFCTCYKEILAANGLSPHLLRSLHQKLEKETYDAGEYFLLTHEDQSLRVVVAREDGIKESDPNAVFLIDHAWTYEVTEARKQLCEIPGLLVRIAEMIGYSVHGENFHPDDPIVNYIIQDMWKYNQTYTLGLMSNQEKKQMWYIMDEFGSKIRHSDSPTALLFPFYYHPKQVSFSVMMLLGNLDYGDEITRDFANGEKDDLLRKCKLLPWFPYDFTHVSTTTPLFSDESYENRFRVAQETLPVSCCPDKTIKKRLKIYMDLYNEYLTDVTSFEIVDDISEADVFYTGKHIRDYRKYSEERPDLYLCQFPGEMILSCKDFFMDLAKRSTSNGKSPRWFPITYDLHSQLPQFISDFQQRAQSAQGANIWICKPWNLARGLGTFISDNIREIIRSRETETPKIASKYIDNPVLILSPEAESPVKFDLRFIILLTSVDPLKVHVCNLFYARLAKKAFSLDRLEDRDCHFTMSSAPTDDSALPYRLSSAEFVRQFEDQYSNFCWNTLLNRIHNCISQFFKSATSRPPPYGLGHYSKSRSMYGIDVMLEWDVDEITGDKIIEPVLLECNFMPDIYAMCRFHPSFLSDAFKFLFLGDESCDVTDVST